MGSQKESQIQKYLSVLPTHSIGSAELGQGDRKKGERNRDRVRGALKSSEKPSDQISPGCRVSQLLKSAAQWELRQATVDITPGHP